MIDKIVNALIEIADALAKAFREDPMYCLVMIIIVVACIIVSVLIIK